MNIHTNALALADALDDGTTPARFNVYRFYKSGLILRWPASPGWPS